MHDCIVITGLEYFCSIGVLDWERQVSQKILVDLELFCDLSACSDSLGDTLDYAKVSSVIGDAVQAQHFELVEGLANHLAKCLHERFLVPELRLTVHKPHAISNAKDVAVRIHRRF